MAAGDVRNFWDPSSFVRANSRAPLPGCLIEAEAVKASKEGDPTTWCYQPSSGPGWYCKRPRGHTGDHIAANSGQINARWEQL